MWLPYTLFFITLVIAIVYQDYWRSHIFLALAIFIPWGSVLLYWIVNAEIEAQRSKYDKR
jgi:hypothetical protein